MSQDLYPRGLVEAHLGVVVVEQGPPVGVDEGVDVGGVGGDVLPVDGGLPAGVLLGDGGHGLLEVVEGHHPAGLAVLLHPAGLKQVLVEVAHGEGLGEGEREQLVVELGVAVALDVGGEDVVQADRGVGQGPLDGVGLQVDHGVGLHVFGHHALVGHGHLRGLAGLDGGHRLLVDLRVAHLVLRLGRDALAVGAVELAHHLVQGLGVDARLVVPEGDADRLPELDLGGALAGATALARAAGGEHGGAGPAGGQAGDEAAT